MMTNDLHDFKRFLKQREEASRAFLNGNIDPLDRISTHGSPATIFGPKGDHVEGADKVNAANAGAAKHFESGGESRFEILQMAANDCIAWWAGIQWASARVKGNPGVVSFNLRVTETFRREDGHWKLVHRHADTLASESEDSARSTTA
jgi:ketosteroid isomerase-like protein